MAKITKKAVDFIKKNWKGLIEGLGLVAILLSLLQLNLQQRQFAYEQQQFAIEQSQKPTLVFDYQYSLSDIDTKIIDDEARILVDMFFDKVYSEKLRDNGNSYLEIVDSLLPFSRELPSKRLLLLILVQNQGLSTANNVQVRFDIARPITNVEVKSLEPITYIDGGIGHDHATLEISRIIPAGNILITVMSDTLPNEQQDKLIIDHYSELTSAVITLEINGGVPPYTFNPVLPGTTPTAKDANGNNVPSTSLTKYLPSIKYFSSGYDAPEIYISSDEGGATKSPAPLITPIPAQ